MAIKSTSQITISDITDAYSVTLSSETFAFSGNKSGGDPGSSCKTSVTAIRGSEVVLANVGTTSSNEITFKKADGTTSDVIIVSNIDTTTTPNQPEITFAVATGKTISEPIEAIIPVKVNNNTITITKKFTMTVSPEGPGGSDGKGISSVVRYFQRTNTNSAPSKNATGNPGSNWSTTMTAPDASNHYLWATDHYTYTDSSTANGTVILASQYNDANKWYSGTGITGTSTTAAVFSGSGVTLAYVGDRYLNTSANTNSNSGNTYECTLGGNASNAKWKYVSNILGKQGIQGPTGPEGPQGPDGEDAILICITSDNGDTFKNSTGNTTLTPEVYVGGVSVTISNASTAGKFPITINENTYYLYWYRGDTKLTSSNTGSGNDKYGEFVSSSPYGRLKVYAGQVNVKQPYTCKIEDA